MCIFHKWGEWEWKKNVEFISSYGEMATIPDVWIRQCSKCLRQQYKIIPTYLS